MAEELLAIVAFLGAILALAGWLAHRLHLPPALGYLAVGVAASPAVKSTPTLAPELIAPIAHVGVLFLLFLIGLDLDLKRLREALRSTLLTLPFDLLVPALAAALLARALGWELQEAVALGFAVCISSTLFGERLADTPGFTSDARRRVLGTLVSEDVAAAGLLAVLAILGGAAGETGWLAPLAAVGRLLFLFILLAAACLLVIPRILDAMTRRHANDLLVLTGIGLVVGLGWIGAWAGSAELGALVAGVAAAEAGSRFVVRNALQGLRDVSLALFFLASGLAVDPTTVLAHPGLVLGVAGIFLAAKLAVHVPANLVAGLRLDASLRGAIALGSLGEFSLILVAAARNHGLANELLAPAVVGAMLVLLLVTPLLMKAAPVGARLATRTPETLQRPVRWMVESLRSRPTVPRDISQRRGTALLLAANVILLVAWGLLAAWAGPRAVGLVPGPRFAAQAVVVGFAMAIAAPLAWRAYRTYRDLVRQLVGIGGGEGVGRIRARLADAWVAGTAVLLLIPLALAVPATLPVLAGGLLLAVVLLALSWRQLARFHDTLEQSVTRVLGHDVETGALLDQVLQKYPWGVRFAAVNVPADSPLAGQTIEGSRLTELTGALVAVLERGGQETVNPPSTQTLRAGDTLILMGEEPQIATAEALVVAHGEALRKTVQSRLAEVVEVPVPAESPVLGRSLGALDLKSSCGALVVGLWPHGAQHPVPYRPDLSLAAGDHLILLGSPLQVERARRMVAP